VSTVKPDPFRDPIQTPGFRSRFGGNWTDLTNANDILEGKLALGEVTAREANLLANFIENGYVILRGAVDPDVIAELQSDVARLTVDGRTESWVDVMENGRSTTRRLAPGDDSAHGKMLKLLDLYSFLPSARRVIFSPPTLRFLQLVFSRPPMAFQSLYFYNGSQQPLHRDTAFVRVSSPMEFTASWTALEDIQPGSGELVYYPFSHLLPEYLFEGKYKWLAPGVPELNDFYAHLNQHAEQSGHGQHKFLANKGDTLIWSADLAHGGGPVDDPAKTRKSLVAHYCPASAHPMYRHYEGSNGVSTYNKDAFYESAKRSFWQAV